MRCIKDEEAVSEDPGPGFLDPSDPSDPLLPAGDPLCIDAIGGPGWEWGTVGEIVGYVSWGVYSKHRRGHSTQFLIPFKLLIQDRFASISSSYCADHMCISYDDFSQILLHTCLNLYRL